MALQSFIIALTLALAAQAQESSSSAPPALPSAASAAPLAAGAIGSVNFIAANVSEVVDLANGNARFRSGISNKSPGLLTQLADDGQTPTSMLIGCSDSRVSEGTIMDAAPGTIFTARQISNQVLSTDAATRAVVAYGVDELRVRNVIVLGHIGCGGVAAAMIPGPPAPISASEALVQEWIQPIRELFATSTEPAIVAKREELAAIPAGTPIEEPEPSDEGFIALVKENVKRGVANLVADPIIQNSFEEYRLAADTASTEARRRRRSRRSCKGSLCARAGEEGEAPLPQEVIVHGFIYDIRNGELSSLGVSHGPEGPIVEESPEASAELVRRIKRDLKGHHAHRH